MGDHIYSDDEFIDMFSNLFDLRVSGQDMRQIKPDFVQKIYACFIRDFGASLEQINQLPFDMCEAVAQYPDMYRSAIRTMALAKVIAYFIKLICDDDSFQPADLFDPKPRRTRKFFSRFVEFYCSASTLSQHVTGVEEHVGLKVNAKQKILDNILQNKEKIRQLKKENAENEIREDEELKQIAQVKGEMQQCQETKVGLKARLDELRVANSNLAITIKDVELQIIEGKERIEKLAGHVVQASERQEIEERERKLHTYKSDNEERGRCLAEHQRNLHDYQGAQAILKDLLDMLHEIQQELTKKKEYMENLGQLERSSGSLVEEQEELIMKTQELNTRLSTRQERVSQMQLSWKLKKEGLQDEVNQQKLVLEETRRSQTEDQIAAQDMEAERQHLEEEAQNTTEQVTNFDHFIANNYYKILQAMDRHNNEVHGALTNLTETINKYKPQ